MVEGARVEQDVEAKAFERDEEFGDDASDQRAAGGKTDAYQYLADSIMAFPEPERLMDIMRGAGLREVRAIPLMPGAAALYLGAR